MLGVLHTCAGHAADEDDQRPPLLEEVGDHLVALDVLVLKAARPHHVEQNCLKVVLRRGASHQLSARPPDLSPDFKL